MIQPTQCGKGEKRRLVRLRKFPDLFLIRGAKAAVLTVTNLKMHQREAGRALERGIAGGPEFSKPIDRNWRGTMGRNCLTAL
jgi:hypothetical protein